MLRLDSPDQVATVIAAIAVTALRSFREDRSTITESELRRRRGMCERIVMQLRCDLGWSVVRILDHLPRYLRCELDGQAWEPEQETTIWRPPAGRA